MLIIQDCELNVKNKCCQQKIDNRTNFVIVFL